MALLKVLTFDDVPTVQNDGTKKSGLTESERKNLRDLKGVVTMIFDDLDGEELDMQEIVGYLAENHDVNGRDHVLVVTAVDAVLEVLIVPIQYADSQKLESMESQKLLDVGFTVQ
jgi:hypothetical protein